MKVCSVCQRCYEDNVPSCLEENHKSFDFARPGTREIIGGFRLDRLLASEATGKTYRATDMATEQTCLFKIIAVSDEQKTKELLRETQLMASLDHPHLVRVHQSGFLNRGEFYLITEDAGGQTLRDCLNQGALVSEVTAIQIARQAAEGLEAIHLAGTAHGNINPENIILTTDLEHRLLVKLQNIDFGRLNERLTMSENSNHEYRLGNLRYFSPEQCDGQPPDAQSDVYSLGIVLYEMLAGEPPFNAPDANALIERQRSVPPPEIKIRNFDIRALLTYTLMDSLQKIPRLRLKKASVFARQLRHIEQLATHSPTPPPVMQNPPVSKPAVVTPPKVQSIKAEPVMHKFNETSNVKNEIPLISEPEIIQPIAVEAEDNPVVFAQAEAFSAPVTIESETLDRIEAESPEPVPVHEPQIAETTDVPLAAAPVVVEWEQPEDIPSEDEVIEIRRREFGETEFIPEAALAVDESHVTREPASRIEIVIDDDEPAPETKIEIPLFAQFDEAEPHRIRIGNRIPLIGAGLAILVAFIVVAGSYINRESGMVHLVVHPSPQPVPAEKLLPEPDEAQAPAGQNEPDATLADNSQAEDAKDVTEMKENFELTDSRLSDTKKPDVIRVAAKRSDETPAKDIAAGKTKPTSAATEKKTSNNAAVKQKPFEDVTIYIKPAPAPIKSDGAVRPRVVQAPAKKRRSMPF